jgi:hypothetical protein
MQEGGGSMARDGALISTWDFPMAGREGKSLEVFMETLGWWSKQASEGKCEEPETFFAADGSSGMTIVRGKMDSLMELYTSDEGTRLADRGQWIVRGLKTHVYLGGSQETLQHVIQQFSQNGQELGYM